MSAEGYNAKTRAFLTRAFKHVGVKPWPQWNTLKATRLTKAHRKRKAEDRERAAA